ncbi:MAG: AAA family ATPase [Calditrichia bacterium]|nr:AAA family ATPase [Calditrichia bacterium]
MAKTKTIFTCQSCGYQTVKWLGKCPDCSAWNTMIEEIISHKSGSAKGKRKKNIEIINLNEVSTENSEVIVTPLKEFNRVMGGGIVPASVVLISGEPGIGKSTFMLQLSNVLAKNHKILYVSGEESLEQIKTRADRLNTSNAQNIKTLSTVELPEIEFAIEQTSPDFVIVDSIQTLYHPDLSGAQGNVSQVRECSSTLFRLAKEKGFTLLLVGHVTKEGSIAGPRVLEHLVDVVL